MSTEEPKTGNGTSTDAKAEPGAPTSGPGSSPPDVDAAVAWPPPEAAPGDEAGAATAAPGTAKVTGSNGQSAAESGIMTAPETKTPSTASSDASRTTGGADPEMPGTAPQEEMGLSNSTLHWLEDGDQAVPGRVTEPGTMPSYDPRAPVAGRRRAWFVTGGAAVIALLIAGTLYSDSQKRRAAQAPAPAVVEPARDLTNRAEAALAGQRYDEALDLAHLALVADQRFADAHFVVASVQQMRNQIAAARESYRKYLELAPLGAHAAASRTALKTMPP